MITGKAYDGLRLFAQLVLPLVGTVYFLIEGGDTVIGMIMVGIFVLGLILWMSQRVYARQIGQGDLIVEDHEGGMELRLALERTPEELASMREVRFEVKRNHDPTPV